MAGLYNLDNAHTNERLITRATWDQALSSVKQFMRKNGIAKVAMRDSDTHQLIRIYINKHHN